MEYATEALEIGHVARVDDVTAGRGRGDDDCVDEGCSGNGAEGLTNNLGKTKGQGFDIDRIEDGLPDVRGSAQPLRNDGCGNRDDLVALARVFEDLTHPEFALLERNQRVMSSNRS